MPEITELLLNQLWQRGSSHLVKKLAATCSASPAQMRTVADQANETTRSENVCMNVTSLPVTGAPRTAIACS